MNSRHRRYLIRNLDDEGYLEGFLVAAIVSILGVRLYLYMTGFPQIGGKGLHVAHMLWGGALMVVGLVMLFNFLDRHSHTLAAIVAGAGFGLFIDELGKFITSDNNYFFRPASSIIYIVFILLYLVFRLLQQERNVTDREYLLNAVEAFKEAVVHNFDRRHMERARAYLAAAGSVDPAAHGLVSLLDTCPPPPPESISRLEHARDTLQSVYRDVIGTRWFPRLVIGFFLLQAIITLASAVVGTALNHGGRGLELASTNLAEGADILFASLGALLTLLGAALFFRSRLRAYILFRLGLLIDIFLTEIFEFYDIQFAALWGLGFNVVGLLIIDTMIAQERRRRRISQVEGPVSMPAQ